MIANDILMEFCNKLPKVELHAHLNGSLGKDCVIKLYEMHRMKYPNEKLPDIPKYFIRGENPGFDKVFELFPLMQCLTDNSESVKYATRSVLEEFAYDNVKYIELRTTPREINNQMTFDDYVRSIIEEIEKVNINQSIDIIARLLLSIDRRKSVDIAQKTFELCQKYNTLYPNILIGLDLSGDARIGEVKDFSDILLSAKKLGFKLSIHCAEVKNENEVDSILRLINPHRIGHGTCIHPGYGGNENLWQLLKANKIPTEICLTSNVFSKSVTSYSTHHVQCFHQDKLPFCICTDDKGVFGCSLSHEYQKVKEILKLSNEDLFSLSKQAIDYIFADENVKLSLCEKWDEFYLLNLKLISE